MGKAYCGIDVSFAKKKRLPVVVCLRHGRTLEPLPLRNLCPKPPMGKGNACIVREPAAVSHFAQEVVYYLREVESEFKVQICRIAIDAPSEPKKDGERRRQCELGLDQRGISCITTPSAAEFEAKRQRALEHLTSGHKESHMPAANQLWMIVGFELFKILRQEGWKCLEVYPQAIAAILGVHNIHKTKKEGASAQLKAAAHHTGWPDKPTLASLFEIGYGSRHDKLDAYLSAWVASLDTTDRKAIGQSPDDAIWVPRCDTVLLKPENRSEAPSL